MEPLDTDLQYVRNAHKPSTPASRLSILYIFPLLGILLLLLFIGAAVFHWDLSVFVDNLVVLMVVLFFVFIAILFWALNPRPGEARG
jgi:hypothetical protein